MAKVLTERVTWTKPRDPNATRRTSDLTPSEQTNVRAALAFLRVRYGGARKLAEAMNARPKTVGHALSPRRNVSAGLALRAARLAGVPFEAVLMGAWPPAGACAHCGRSG